MLYGGETWPVKVEDENRLKRTETTMIRWMCGSKIKQRKSTEQMLNILGLNSILLEVTNRRLRWYGHVSRREENNWVRLIQQPQANGTRTKGRPQKGWNAVIKADFKRHNTNGGDASNRNKWNKILKGIK